MAHRDGQPQPVSVDALVAEKKMTKSPKGSLQKRVEHWVTYEFNRAGNTFSLQDRLTGSDYDHISKGDIVQLTVYTYNGRSYHLSAEAARKELRR